MTMLTTLSDELLISIAQYVGAITYEPGAVREDYPEPGHVLNLALCSRRFHAICEPILYTNFCQQGKGCNRSLASFLEVILARPDLAAQVKTICVASDFTGDLATQNSATDWEIMVMSIIVIVPNLEAVYLRGWTTIWSSMFGNSKSGYYNILPEVSACQQWDSPFKLKKIVWEWQSDGKEAGVNLLLRKCIIRSSMRALGRVQSNFLTVDSFSCIPSRKLHDSCLVLQGDELRRETLARSGTTYITYHRPRNTADLFCGNLPPLKRFHQKDHLLHDKLSVVPFHLTADLQKSKSTLEHLEKT